MNERLMELAVQANLGPACESQAIAIKKFAELIVRECVPMPLHSLDSDVRELGKWLNEEPNRPLNRPALARVLAYLQGYGK